VALATALVVLLAASLLAAAVADVARTEARLAQSRRTVALGLAAADACIAHVVDALPAGWDLARELAGPDAVAGTSDDGMLAAPPDCAAVLAPGPLGVVRPFLDVTASLPGGGRRVRAIVGRSRAPVPAVVWASTGALGTVTGRLEIDGIDAARPDLPALSGFATPDDPAAVDSWMSGFPGMVLAPGTAPAIHAPSPPLLDVASRLAAAGSAPVFVPTVGTPLPERYVVPGDLTIVTAGAGAGLLYVDGRLDIRANCAFSGIVAARGGVGVASGVTFRIAGGVWVGSPAFDVSGDAVVRHDRAALDAAEALLPFPRLATVAGVVDR
jgi:hypothetical protein